MQFKEQDINRLIWACQYRKEHIDFEKKGAKYWYEVYNDLQLKLETYREEYDCPDCTSVRCETHV